MSKLRLTFCLHRSVIVLVCLSLLVVLMQGVSWLSLDNQMACSEQAEDLARTLSQQVAFSLTPVLENHDDNHAKIQALLDNLTHNSRIPDATLYDTDGSLIAHSGENINVRDRLALNGQRTDSYFTHQIVQPLKGKDGSAGFLRFTLDTHRQATEAWQIDNRATILRLMILIALVTGMILSRTLLHDRRIFGQRFPFLLTASTSVTEDENTITNTTEDTAVKDKHNQ
ncbi:YtjB family periplasmic protein [Enterobacteriaceae bacterium LUAb1]